MAIVRQTIVYDGPGGPFEGVFAYDDEVETARPGVMVIPNVLGQKESDNVTPRIWPSSAMSASPATCSGRASARTRESPNPAHYMNEIGADRAQLRDRLAAQPRHAQGVRVRRSGADRGVSAIASAASASSTWRARAWISSAGSASTASTTGPITPTSRRSSRSCWSATAGTTRSARPTRWSRWRKELTEGGADWQIHAYGNAGHAFTDTDPQGPTGATPGCRV